MYWKIIENIYKNSYTRSQSHLALCTEFHVSRMQTNICRSFPLLIQGWTHLKRADFLACYTLERPKSLRSGFAPCPHQHTYIAVLDVFYSQAHKMSLTNQGTHLRSGWIRHNIWWNTPSVLWKCNVRNVICRCQIQNTRTTNTVYKKLYINTFIENTAAIYTNTSVRIHS